jgi:hypothetical protein
VAIAATVKRPTQVSELPILVRIPFPPISCLLALEYPVSVSISLSYSPLLIPSRPCPDLPRAGASYYVRSKALSPEHYQALMDRGWRRSGSLLYLPDALRSCCPHYTIR